jgi:hypothetical protein
MMPATSRVEMIRRNEPFDAVAEHSLILIVDHSRHRGEDVGDA